MPKLPRRGQPKTLAAALKALTESRKYAADVTAAARTMQLVDHKLRSKLADQRADAITQRAALRKEIEALQDELEALQERLDDAKHGEPSSQPESAAMEQKEREIAELRATNENEAARHAEELRVLNAQASSTAAVCDHLSRQNAELSRSSDGLRAQNDSLSGQVARAEAEAAALHSAVARATSESTAYRSRAEAAEHTLASRDEDLQQQRRKLLAAENAQREAHFLAESESRSLRAEQERRMAAEKHIEQLTLNLESLSQAAAFGRPLPNENPFDILRAENRTVRRQRDEAAAEREHLASRMLQWMAPGQYLEHAASSGYDITQDPLIRTKREEIRVEGDYFRWQEANGMPRKAREFDQSQTDVEQAYAAAFAARWAIVHKKHRRLKHDLKWVVVGFLLDSQSEDYLLRLSTQRIERMERQMVSG